MAAVRSAGHAKRFDATAIALPVLTTILFLAVVEALKRVGLLPVFIPAPSQLITVVIQDPATVTWNLGPTISAALQGYIIAAIIALIAGSIGATIRIIRGPIYNFGVILNSIPIIAIAPLMAVWLGTGPSLRITIAALSSQFPMLVGMMQGLEAADIKQRELFHALSASKWKTFRYLLLPNALPFIFAGLKIGAPAALLGTVTAEWAGADRGIGAMMLYALFSYNIVKVWLSVVLTCALAAGSYGFLAFVETKVRFWSRGMEGR